MVLDGITGDIVTVKELLKRDRYRSSSSSDRSRSISENVPATLKILPERKRKMDGSEDGEVLDPDSKRLCIEG